MYRPVKATANTSELVMMVLRFKYKTVYAVCEILVKLALRFKSMTLKRYFTKLALAKSSHSHGRITMITL